jgi:hypothetical protein
MSDNDLVERAHQLSRESGARCEMIRIPGRDLVVATEAFGYRPHPDFETRELETGEVFALEGHRLDHFLNMAGAFRGLASGERTRVREDGRLFVVA